LAPTQIDEIVERLRVAGCSTEKVERLIAQFHQGSYRACTEAARGFPRAPRSTATTMPQYKRLARFHAFAFSTDAAVGLLALYKALRPLPLN
jgi:hypothetical protein